MKQRGVSSSTCGRCRNFILGGFWGHLKVSCMKKKKLGSGYFSTLFLAKNVFLPPIFTYLAAPRPYIAIFEIFWLNTLERLEFWFKKVNKMYFWVLPLKTESTKIGHFPAVKNRCLLKKCYFRDWYFYTFLGPFCPFLPYMHIGGVGEGSTPHLEALDCRHFEGNREIVK